MYVKKWKEEPLTPMWGGPYQVLLITPTTVKCLGIKAWIHYIRVKKTQEPKVWRAETRGDLKLRLATVEAPEP